MRPSLQVCRAETWLTVYRALQVCEQPSDTNTKHFKIFGIFRDRNFSDLIIFDLRFLQAKQIFNFRFFHDQKYDQSV